MRSPTANTRSQSAPSRPGGPARSKQTIGLYIRILDDFLARHPDTEALLNSYRWLPEPGQAGLVA